MTSGQWLILFLLIALALLILYKNSSIGLGNTVKQFIEVALSMPGQDAAVNLNKNTGASQSSGGSNG